MIIELKSFNEFTVGGNDIVTLHVTENKNRISKQNGYFKVVPGANAPLRRNSNVARIKFYEPDYIWHKGSIKLNRKQKKALVEYLSSYDSASQSTNWVRLIKEYNRVTVESSSQKNMIPENLPMPDYTKLP